MTGTRLPDDERYWEALAARVERAAWAAHVDDDATVRGWLAARVPLVAGTSLAAAAALLAWAFGPSGLAGAARADSPARMWAAALEPRDALGRRVGAAMPPRVAQLIAPAPRAEGTP